MTLTFTQENGLYVAEFEATAPFSIHLERPRGGFINMLQRSVDSGTFVAVKNFNPNYNATQVIDADCGQGAVYPKWIRFESAVEPSVAEVTFEDEQSGGGAGESTMEYLDLRGVDNSMKPTIIMASQSVKLEGSDISRGVQIITTGMYMMMAQTPELVTAISIDMQMPITKHMSGEGSQELTILNEGFGDMVASIPRITKEQFYNLEA